MIIAIIATLVIFINIYIYIYIGVCVSVITCNHSHTCIYIHICIYIYLISIYVMNQSYGQLVFEVIMRAKRSAQAPPPS